MKNGIKKRSISIVMAFVLILVTVVTALPSGLFTTVAASVDDKHQTLGACVMPQTAYSNSAFMTNCVSNDLSFSLNKNFKSYSSSSNLKPGISSTLNKSKYTKKNHDSLWQAKWRYTPSSNMKELMKNGQITMGYSVNLYNDHHSNGSNHWGKKWGKAMISITGVTGSSQKQFVYEETEDKNDEQAQYKSGTFTAESYNYYYYWAGNNRCVCNGSAVGDSVVYAVDTKSPTIKKCYISKSDGGSAISATDTGFKVGETGYLILECSENIRFATNSASNLKLNLNAYYKSNGQKAGTIEANLIKLNGKKLVFKFTVPGTVGNKTTDVVVKSVGMSSDAWAGRNMNYDMKLVDENGNTKTYSDYSFKATSKITDLAGNGIKWTGDKTLDNNAMVFMDGVDASVQKISLSTEKVARVDIPTDSSNGTEASRTDVFSAVGDKLTFTVTYNDRLNTTDASKFTATLNVKDANGNYITLKGSSAKHILAKSVDGVDGALGYKTEVKFDTFEITSAMYQDDGSKIKINSISVSDGKDICGNGVTQNVSVQPNEAMYIDRLSPNAKVNLTPAANVYTPSSSNSGKVLTFPITVDDNTETGDTTGVYSSDVTGILGGFKWISSGKYKYEYCWSKNSTPSANENWKTLYTATNKNDTSKNTNGVILQNKKSDGNIYLHIRLIDGVDYGAANDTNKGIIKGNLVINTLDNAGNAGTDEFSFAHLADNTPSVMQQVSSSIEDTDSSRTGAKVSTKIKVTDDFGVQSVTYTWMSSGETVKTEQYDMSTVTDRKNFYVSLENTFSQTSGETEKIVSVEAVVTDYAGHTTKEIYEYTLYFEKLENRYSINLGTASNPVTIPTLEIKKPDSIKDTGGGTVETLSYVEVKFTTGGHYIYICNSTDTKDIFTDSTYWYYVDSSNTGSGNKTVKLTYNYSSTNNGISAYDSLKSDINNCYGTGEMTITVRTVDNFSDSESVLTINYDSEEDIAVNVHDYIYMAHNGNYAATVKTIIDNTGNDVKSSLAFDENSKSTMYTLDGVSFVYSIKGEKEETFDYNLADINIDSSYAELYKWTGENKHTDADTQSGTLCETYPMSRVREQGFTVSSDISENNGTGWYYIKIVVTTTDGSQLVTYYNDIYIDRYMYNIDFGDYYKNYTKTLEYKGEEQTVNYNIAELIYDDSEIDLNAYFSQTGDYTIGMGIAEAPDGYSVEQWMTFLGPVLQSDNGIKRSVRFRIYNVFDENYKTNAVWHTVDNEQEEKLYTYNIKEAELVDGNYVFDESSYCSGGAYYIPLMNGINEICCEVENMNGQTTTQTFYINATKEIIPAEGETTTTETEVEYELDADVLDSHSYIKMLCHDFYTGDGYNFAIQGTGGYGYICYESGIYEFVLYYGNYNISNRKDYNDNLSVGTIDATGVDGMQPIVENVSYEQDGMNFCYSFTVSDNNALDLDNLVNLTYNGEYNYKLLNANGSYTDTSEDAEEEVPTEEPATEEPPTEEPVAEALAAPVSYAEPYDYDPSDTGVNYPTAELNYKVQFGEIDEETGIGTWTDYSIANCGIYKTQISKNDDNSANVSIWGTYMYQDDVEDGGYCYGYVNFNILDAKGNVGIQKKEYELDGEQKYDYRNTQVIYSYENKKPSLEIKGSYEEDSENVEFGNIYNYDDTICFDSEGNIVAECDVPLNRVLSYGAYTNVVAISENITDDSENPSDNDDYYYDEKFSQYKYHFLSSVPMIKNTGYYEMEFMDIFGNTYQQTLDATKAFEEGSDNIVINYSEKDITNQNVTVMANLEAVSGQAVDTEAEITTIFAVYADEAGSRVSGEMDLFSSGAASIVLEDNATVTVEGYYKGTKVSKTVKVNNIDKQIEEVKIEYLYGEGVTEPNFIDGSTDTVDGSVKAILYCDEELYGINGDTKYVFPVGSKKGDKYTFEYKDEAGNTGSAVAVLEYNIDKTVPPEPDTTAPEFEGTISGLRYNYTLLDSIFDVDEDGNTSESSRINDVISDYTARAYKMEFNVTDESKVKLIVRKSGEEAPTSYNDTSDSIDGLKVSGYTIEITKAASFDLYFADTEGNVKAITGFNINSIDNEAANVEIKYKSLRNDDGTAFIRAYIVADEAEEVVVINSDARTFMNEETVTEIGQEVTKLVKRYYHDFSENDVYVFKYTDVYGNSAVTKAEVKGVDFAPPSLLSTNWYGTKRVTGKDSNSIVVNEAPDTVGLSNVNNNITATLSYNKPISGVKLYEYDETQENGLGKEITGDSVVVTAACLNKNVTVTYENNFGKVVVETQAKSSGKKSYNTLLAVGCIDKELPVISVSEGTVSKNKQKVTYTITTDKETYLNGETEKSVEHIYVAERNGEHKIKVMDAAGNVSSCTITVTEIDNEILEMQFGSSADNMTSNIENLKINAGDKLYVKPSKAATVTLGSVSVTLNAGETGELQLQSDAGMYLLHAVDSSTGKEYSYKVLMVYKDRSAPAISFDSTIVRLPAGTDRATIEAALKNGITVEDNVDGIIDSSNVLIEIPEKLDAGIHIITYTVSDKAGNEATATRSLYLYEEGTPNLIINGNEAIPYGTMVVTDSSITVQGTNLDKGSVLIKYRYGIKTAAQMKYGTTGVLLNGALKDKQQTFDLPKTSGFYTIYIRTQNRKEQITYVYVDLSE